MSNETRSQNTLRDSRGNQPATPGIKGFALGAELVIGLAVIGGMILVPLISSQNRRLKQQMADTTAALGTLEATMRQNIALSALQGSPFPPTLTAAIRASVPSFPMPAKEYLLVAYTYSVCVRCLHDGLVSLQHYSSLKARSPGLIALAGEVNTRDRERALAFRADGLAPYPIVFVPDTILSSALFRFKGREFADEPVYLRVSGNATIESAFLADQKRPELLDEWLDARQQW